MGTDDCTEKRCKVNKNYKEVRILYKNDNLKTKTDIEII